MTRDQSALRRLQLDTAAMADKPLRAFSVHGYDYMDLSSLPSLPVLNVDNAQLLGDEEDVVKWRPGIRFGRVQVGKILWGNVLKVLSVRFPRLQRPVMCNRIMLLSWRRGVQRCCCLVSKRLSANCQCAGRSGIV